MLTQADPGAAGRLVAMEGIRPHLHALCLLVLVLVSLAYRVHVSHACSLWLDEDYTHVEIARDWGRVLRGPEPTHPPLFFVLTKLVSAPFVYSETTLRALSLGCGCVLLGALYWLCLELGLERTRALVVVAWAGLTPFFIGHATEARMYALYAALAALAAACWLRLLREPNKIRYFAGFAASAAAMAWTHYFGLAYALALLGVLLAGMVPRWKQMELTPRRSVALALLLTALLWVLFEVLTRALELRDFYAHNKLGRGTAPWPSLLHALITESALSRSSGFAANAELVLAAAGLVLVGRRLRGLARAVPFGLVFGAWGAALLITSGHFVATRYLAPSWVFYQVGLCVGLFACVDLLRRLAARARPRLAPLAWALLLVPVAARLVEYPVEFGAGEDDYRGFQRYFLEHLAANTALVTFPGSTGLRMIGREYPVGAPPIELEHFKPRPGVTRYLIAEIHARGEARQAELARLIEKNFGLSRDNWEALPLLDLPDTTYQPAVRARLIVWDGQKVVPTPESPARPARHRHRHRHAEPTSDT